MLLRMLAGKTVRITVRDLTHLDTGPVTAGAIVTIQLIAPTGAVTTATAGANGDDWSADFAPTIPGRHAIKATATVGAAVWEGKGELWVDAF